MKTYGESIYGTEGGPYISGQWGGACMKGNKLYLHIFQWDDRKLKLPALPREVLHCKELGGENVTFAQTDVALVLILKGGKERRTHSVVKLILGEGPDIPLLPVEEQASTEQRKTRVNPMGRCYTNERKDHGE